MDAILGRDDRLVAKLVDAADKIDAYFAAIVGTPVPAVIGTDYQALKRMCEKKTDLPILSLIVQIRNQLTCCRITDLIRRTKGLFQILGCFQCCRRYNNIFANFRCPFYCLKPIAHSIANGFFSFFFQFLSYFICCFQIAYILWF